MTIEEKIKQIMDANKDLKRRVSEQNAQLQDWITEMRHAQGLLESKEYDKGLVDAWEAVRKLKKLTDRERLELFNGIGCEWIVSSIPPQEVMQKLKDWEGKKESEVNEIHVGDEVIAINRERVGVYYEPFAVTGISSRGEVSGVGAKYAHMMMAKKIRKTGRHFPEIATVMERLKEVSE